MAAWVKRPGLLPSPMAAWDWSAGPFPMTAWGMSAGLPPSLMATGRQLAGLLHLPWRPGYNEGINTIPEGGSGSTRLSVCTVLEKTCLKSTSNSNVTKMQEVCNKLHKSSTQDRGATTPTTIKAPQWSRYLMSIHTYIYRNNLLNNTLYRIRGLATLLQHTRKKMIINFINIKDTHPKVLKRHPLWWNTWRNLQKMKSEVTIEKIEGTFKAVEIS